MNAQPPPNYIFDVDVQLSDADADEPVHYFINYWHPMTCNLRLHFDAVSRMLVQAEVLPGDTND